MFPSFRATIKLAWRAVRTVALLGSLAACARTPTSTVSPVFLTASGSTAMNPLLTLLADRFHERYPSITVIVEASNSAQGMEQVVDGTAELGALSVPPRNTVWVAPIAVGGIAIIVHPDNPVQDLTLMQVREVFAGRIWHWSELEVNVAQDEIAVVSREQGSGTRILVEALVMADAHSPDTDCQPRLSVRAGSGSSDDAIPGGSSCAGDAVTSTAIIMPGSPAVIEYVATHTGAVGYVSSGYLAEGVSPAQVHTVRVEGVPPTPEHVADASYRLTQPLFLVAPREPSGAARRFVDFCLSSEGQAVVARQYVPVRGAE